MTLRIVALLTAFTFLAMTDASAQRYYDVWHFGKGYGLDFRGPFQKQITGSLDAVEGSSTICDPVTGELLMYTEGVHVWNRNNQLMMNGSGLFGNSSSAQSAVIVPDPSDPYRYYIFTQNGYTDGGHAPPAGLGLRYSEVDMRGDGGLGRVVRKNVLLLDTDSEALACVRDASGCGYWILTNTNGYLYAWSLSNNSLVEKPVVTPFNIYSQTFRVGKMIEASPDGRLLAITTDNVTTALYNFDPVTGRLGEFIERLGYAGDASFSPDNSKLYIHTYGWLYQYDLSRLPGTVTETLLDTTLSAGGIQLGPDGKIYVLRIPWLQPQQQRWYIDVISEPNRAGRACGYGRNLYSFDGNVQISSGFMKLPNCIDGYLGSWTPTGDATAFDIIPVRDTIICPGESLRIPVGAEEAIAFRWESDPTLSCTDCPDPVATPSSESTTYIVRATERSGCVSVDTLTIYVNHVVADAGPDTTVCVGGSVRLKAGAGESYQWEFDPSLSCLDCPDPIASPDSETTYRLTITDEFGCTAVDEVTVFVTEPHVDIKASRTEICAGEDVRLSADRGSEFRWTPATGLSCDDCANPVATPLTTTTYHLVSTIDDDCPAYDSVTLIVHPAVQTDAGSDTSLCRGESVRLSARGAARYEWSPSDGLSCLTCPDPVAQPVVTTTYHLLGTNEEGTCQALDSVTVSVFDLPKAEAGSDTVICPGGVVSLQASGGSAYRWDQSPDLSCLECASPTTAPSRTATYYVTVFNDPSCSSRDSVTVRVVPPFEISAGGDAAICLGEEVLLEGGEAERWKWWPADGLSCTDCRTPRGAPQTTTTYRLTGWNDAGCVATDEVTVIVREEPEIVRLRIGRNNNAAIGETLRIPVRVVDAIRADGLGELVMELRYDPGVMRIDATSIAEELAGTSLDRWTVLIDEQYPGTVRFRLISPDGLPVELRETLFAFRARMFVGHTPGTEIELDVATDDKCLSVVTEPGYAAIDSICGLNFRLIESSAEKYVPPHVYPNPGDELITFDLSLGLDGATTLEVFDAEGRKIGRIVNGHLESGHYTVQWDAGTVSSGFYWYRLTSGDRVETGRIRIEH